MNSTPILESKGESQEMMNDKADLVEPTLLTNRPIDDQNLTKEKEVIMVSDNIEAQRTEIEIVDEATKREHVSCTTNDIFTSINEDQRIRKKDNVDEAVICPLTKRIRLLTNKTNIRRNYGYDVGEKTYLFPEEALYFIETLKLQVLIDSIPVSIQRARSLFLNQENDKIGSIFDGITCGFDEYTVFKFLAKEGYRPRRPTKVVSLLHKLVPTSTPNSGSNFSSDLVIKQKASDISDEVQDIEMQSESDPLAVPSKESGDSSEIQGGLTSSTVHSEDELNSSSGVKRKKVDSSSSDNNVECDEKRGKFFSVDEEMAPKDPTDVHASDVIFSSTRELSESPEIICDFQSSSLKESNEGQSVLEEDNMMDDKNIESYSDEFSSFPPEQIMLEDSSSSSSFFAEPSMEEKEEEPMPSTSKGSEPYIVVEVDSDIEFVDEVIFAHPGVQIEELTCSIGVYYECERMEDEILPDIDEPEVEDEPEAEATSSCTEARQGSHILVDLVSSDEEEEMVDKSSIQIFADSIWTKLVPHSTALLGFPPGELIPEEIRRANNSRFANQTNENPKEDDMQTDEQLGEIVVGLRLDSEEIEEDPAVERRQPLNGSHAKSWEDWRQESEQKGRDIFQRSLLGANGESHQNCDTDFAKLNLWKIGWGQNGSDSIKVADGEDNHNLKDSESYYKFDLYPPKHNKCGKKLLVSTIKPSHRLYIIREMETLISLSNLISSEVDVPLLVAVVNEDQNVTFVSPGSKGAPNLFPRNE